MDNSYTNLANEIFSKEIFKPFVTNNIICIKDKQVNQVTIRSQVAHENKNTPTATEKLPKQKRSYVSKCQERKENVRNR